MSDSKVPVFTRLKPETKKAIEAEAKKEERTLSAMISRICDKWVEKNRG